MVKINLENAGKASTPSGPQVNPTPTPPNPELSGSISVQIKKIIKTHFPRPHLLWREK